MLWHLKSHTLPKAPSQSSEFSGAEFGKKNAGFIGGKTFQGENRRTVPEFGKAEFWSFVPLQRKTQCLRQNLVAKAAKTPLP